MSEERTLEYVVQVVLGVSLITVLGFITATIYGALQRRLIVATELERKIEEGRAFSSSKRFTLAAGGSVRILFNNRSGRNVKVVAVEINTQGNINVDIYDNVTVESSGSKWIIRNLNLASNNTIDVDVEDGGTYSGGELVHQTIGYGGAKNFAVGSLSEVGERVIVPGGRNIMLEVTNITSQDFDISVRFIFYEAD